MHRYMIACPYCHATSPADAHFCIECSAALQQAATNTTHGLIDSPDLNVTTRICVTHHPATLGHLRIRLAGTILGGILVLLAVLANRTFRLDIVVLLSLIISVVQFVRGTLRAQVITGLRAAVIGVAFVLAMITPWALTICIGAGALLVALHLVDNQRIPSHRRP